MRTVQDLFAIGEDEKKKQAFVRSLISEHKASDLYKTAKDGYEYYCHRNVTITEYQKLLYTVSGAAIPDNWSANYKMACRHFHRFVTQEVQYLLGNGVTWEDETTSTRIENERYSFDGQIKKIAKAALWGGVAFGFYNLDHVEAFTLLDFIPLYDEVNGALAAGVRFWQIDSTKPLRATLYESDGYTEYIWSSNDATVLKPKTKYILKVRTSAADGTEIYDGENYPTFPIVPLYGNDEKQSELVGLREQIDCYDLIKSGFANTVDEASYVYWTIQNAGGMDEMDLAKFIERMKTVHAAVMDDDGAHAESHTMDVPYESRAALLDRLDSDMYRDAMALDVDRIAGGAVTATQIEAAYENLNAKVDDFEYCVLDFIQGIMTVAGIKDNPTFTRSRIVNQTEMIQTLIQAGQYLESGYVTEKILTILGDGDKAEAMIEELKEVDINRLSE